MPNLTSLTTRIASGHRGPKRRSVRAAIWVSATAGLLLTMVPLSAEAATKAVCTRANALSGLCANRFDSFRNVAGLPKSVGRAVVADAAVRSNVSMNSTAVRLESSKPTVFNPCSGLGPGPTPRPMGMCMNVDQQAWQVVVRVGQFRWVYYPLVGHQGSILPDGPQSLTSEISNRMVQRIAAERGIAPTSISLNATIQPAEQTTATAAQTAPSSDSGAPVWTVTLPAVGVPSSSSGIPTWTYQFSMDGRRGTFVGTSEYFMPA